MPLSAPSLPPYLRHWAGAGGGMRSQTLSAPHAQVDGEVAGLLVQLGPEAHLWWAPSSSYGSTAATRSSCRWGLSTRAASAASGATSAVTLVMTRCSPAGCPAPAMLILATPGRAGTAGLGEWPYWTREAWAGGSAGLGANHGWCLKDRQAETEAANSRHGVPLITRNYYTH